MVGLIFTDHDQRDVLLDDLRYTEHELERARFASVPQPERVQRLEQERAGILQDLALLAPGVKVRRP